MRHTSLIGLFALLGLTAAARADDVLIKTRDGATLSAIVALPDPKPAGRLSTILIFEIYTKPEEQKALVAEFAARGYAGVVANSRGKYVSPDQPVPYEHAAADATAVIDWISKQPWSDGKVGMIGSSYSGYTAWAATKRKHPALKGIAVSAAAIPGLGLPMYNNIFISANYAWAFHVTNNKLVDDEVYAKPDRWRKMMFDWFASGRPYREIDAVDGTPNPWLQRWLQHPGFDKFWQDMVPYGNEFSRINIPVLSITGYYDDGQISALKYFKEHVAKARDAEHYLVIGPWDHPGTNARDKPAVLRDYAIDPVAQLDTLGLELEFMDYVLKGKAKPPLLADRVNYEVMGANQWRHATSLGAMHGVSMRLYFSDQKDEGLYSLANRQPPSTSKVVHEVDLADRNRFHNFHAWPGQIIQGPLQYVTEAVFATTPFDSATTIMGEFSGELLVKINKKDFDLGITVYEAMPDGKLFHLGYTIQRASYAEDPEKRKLLTPGKETKIRFETTLVARQMQPGSRLLLLVDVNKTPFGQVNYGTGKDVSDESVQDAGAPLKLEILSGSHVEIPLDNSIPKPRN